MTTAKVFKVLGDTDTVTVCELCGREELKGTIALAELDTDGNQTGRIVHYGASCGRKAAGWTTRELAQRVRIARDEKRDADRAAYDKIAAEYIEAREAYTMMHYQTLDMALAGRRAGTNPYAVLVEFEKATGRRRAE
jgi:hypothetical protein